MVSYNTPIHFFPFPPIPGVHSLLQLSLKTNSANRHLHLPPRLRQLQPGTRRRSRLTKRPPLTRLRDQTRNLRRGHAVRRAGPHQPRRRCHGVAARVEGRAYPGGIWGGWEGDFSAREERCHVEVRDIFKLIVIVEGDAKGRLTFGEDSYFRIQAVSQG